jgi:hypothetical protein
MGEGRRRGGAELRGAGAAETFKDSAALLDRLAGIGALNGSRREPSPD